jgi:hypothetical protein
MRMDLKRPRPEVIENIEESFAGQVADQEDAIRRGDDGGHQLQRGDSREGHAG